MPHKSDKPGLLQGFEETKAYSWKRQSWRQPHHSGRREPSRGSSSGGGSCSSPSESGVSPISGSNSGSEVTDVSGSDNFRGRRDRKSNKPIICHGCREPGHIRPQCPKRIRTVRSPDSESPDMMFVSGWIGGSPVERLKFDSGADRSLVRKDLVPPAAYTGKVGNLVTWKGNDPSRHKLAKVPIKVGKVEVLATVAVVEQLDCPALLGADLGHPMTRQLIKAVMANMDDDDDVSDEVPMQSDSSVNIEVPMQSDSSVNIEVPMQSDSSVNIEVPIQIEPEVACEAPPVVLEDIFCFDDSLFEPEVACEAPPVVLEDIFCFDDSLFEPEVACEAPPVVLEDIFCFDDSLFEPEDACDAPTVVMDDIFSLSVFPFGPDLGEVEFPLPELDGVLEASVASVVAPACGDTFVVPRQLTDVDDEVLEVLEASVAPVCCSNFVVPRHLEEVHDEVLEAGVASVDSVEIVVPMQQVVVKVDVAVDWMAPADAVSDAVSDTVEDYFNLPEEFFVEDQADVVASGPVVCKPMVGLDVAEFVDSLSETDPVLAPVPVARPEPETVVNFVILAMEDSIPPKLCWQSPTVLVDHCLRCTCCVTKATGKFAPDSCTVILMFDVFILMISTICSFCSCISMCLSKFLVVLFFGAFGPRAVPLLPGLDDPPWRMLGAPSVSWVLDWLGFSLWTFPLPLLLRPWVSRRGGRCYGVSLPCCSSPLTFSHHTG